jgi:hypothetical protein
VVKRSAKASWAQQLLQWLATVKSYLNLDTEHPDDIERNIPDWVFPTQQNLPTTHQSLPDGVLVMPIEGRGRHLDPKQIPIRGKDIHLVEFKFCSDINPQQTLEKAHNQHQPLIQRLIQRLQNKEPEASLDATKSHFILLGVGGTIYNPYTITPLLNLGIPLRKVHQLATARHCHAIKSFNKITKTRNKIQSTTTTVLID